MVFKNTECKKTHGMNNIKNLGTYVPSQQGQLIYRFSKVPKPTLGSTRHLFDA